MSSMIQYWDRKTQSYLTEKVYGEGAIKLAYESTPGRILTRTLLSRPWLSKLYGATQSTPASAKKIPGFIKQYEIDMREYEQGPFKTFNDFFTREFKPGLRTFTHDPRKLCAFAEARYLAYESVTESHSHYIKGTSYNLEKLLGSAELARDFEESSLWIARLCPVDYHRFHYPIDSEVLESRTIHGKLHSVNPVAMKAIPNLIQENERHLTILRTHNGAKLAYIEVGALMVGKIVQTNCNVGQTYIAGDEKGYFLFGASTVVLLAEKGSYAPTHDLIEQTKKGFETRVLLGENIGTHD